MLNRATGPARGDVDQELVVKNERQDVVTDSGAVVGQDVGTASTVDYVESRRSTADWINGLISLVIGLIAILIAIRVVLKLLAANTASGFTHFIYGVTGPFVAPFQGIFGTPSADNGAVFEISSILAIAIYLLVGWLLMRLVALLIDRPTTGVSVTRNVDQRTIR
jgi:YggT family protein